MLGGVTRGGRRLTFRGRQAPQEAAVSVNVFFYLKKVGRQCKEETTKSQSESGKQGALGQICKFRMCDAQFSRWSQPELRPLSSPRSCTRILAAQTPAGEAMTASLQAGLQISHHHTPLELQTAHLERCLSVSKYPSQRKSWTTGKSPLESPLHLPGGFYSY